jgi:hypothetical protein
MPNEVFITYRVECSKCGTELDVEVLATSGVINVDPCLKCTNKMADEYKDNLREKILTVVDNDK